VLRLTGLVAIAVLAGACSSAVALTAAVSAVATSTAAVGGPAQLVVTVTNTGPRIPHLGLVFRTTDTWFGANEVTDLGGCTVDSAMSAFDCGDLQAGATGVYALGGKAKAPGSFHFELAVRELVAPFDYVNDHSDGPDIQVWDERVAAS
jgi:hypothetical protein